MTTPITHDRMKQIIELRDYFETLPEFQHIGMKAPEVVKAFDELFEEHLPSFDAVVLQVRDRDPEQGDPLRVDRAHRVAEQPPRGTQRPAQPRSFLRPGPPNPRPACSDGRRSASNRSTK